MVDVSKIEVEQFLTPTPIPGKEELFRDIHELGHSIGGFLETRYWFSCELLRETERLLINAISLFEKGYFDAAFYLLREAIEVSTTFVYLYDLPDDKRKTELAAWESGVEKFKMPKGMMAELEKFGINYPDFKAKMPAFFAKQMNAYSRLNKYVHKQGFERLYIYRWRLGAKELEAKSKEMLNDFLSLTGEAIGIAAIARLMIDPMPLLLMSEEIAYRLGDTLEDPFSLGFVEKYIGAEIIDQYKATRIYGAFKADIMKREKLGEEAYCFVRWNTFDRKDIPKIINQLHLLSFHHWVVLNLAAKYEDVIAIYLYDGFISFMTETPRKKDRPFDFSTEEFKKMRLGREKANIPYKNAFITIVNVNGCEFFLEREEKFDPFELLELSNYAKVMTDEIVAVDAKAEKVAIEGGDIST